MAFFYDAMNPLVQTKTEAALEMRRHESQAFPLAEYGRVNGIRCRAERASAGKRKFALRKRGGQVFLIRTR